ncbi:MAG: hypothetical protein U5R46_02200 [Gammaproteobacteria bacterium]|nr:hypothetical protein [Gammaproteobacteria bacterium]
MRDVRLKRAIIAAALFAALLWMIQIAGTMMALPLDLLGIRPGAPAGLHGVLTAPLMHGSFIHLLANTPPLLVLGPAMLYGFPRAARIALPTIWLGAGLHDSRSTTALARLRELDRGCSSRPSEPPQVVLVSPPIPSRSRVQ